MTSSTYRNKKSYSDDTYCTYYTSPILVYHYSADSMMMIVMVMKMRMMVVVMKMVIVVMMIIRMTIEDIMLY